LVDDLSFPSIFHIELSDRHVDILFTIVLITDRFVDRVIFYFPIFRLYFFVATAYSDPELEPGNGLFLVLIGVVDIENGFRIFQYEFFIDF